ncbi:hypothetical protein WA026_016347 [Henosepilachna vigintioctopunctata]|uniref:adenylate cyclase n=1 Tax=Henosepilachna vigintioctopunctata TaxID=420089 RepID=A0AAW1UNR1_9CUCU
MNVENVGHNFDDLDHSDVINVRQSIHNIKHKLNNTVKELYEDLEDDRKWNLFHLMKMFQTKDIQDLFEMYTQRLNQSFFALLMLLQSGLFAVHFLIVACSTESVTSNLLDLILYAFITFISIAMFIVTDGRDYKVLSNNTLQLMSLVFFVLLLVVNMAVPLYYYFHAEVLLRPAYTKHIIISCYVFFFISNFAVTFAFSLLASAIHLLVLTFVTYENLDSDVLTRRILSDTIEILCINGLGIYYHYLNEIIKRRSFLDRRACVIFNKHLEFQEQQEKQLMGTLIPSYVIENVKGSISHYLDRLENIKSDSAPIEYKTSFMQKFENVTILYADVVNYTEMTVKLNPNELLETLNELFGNFDDVSERLKVLRIKFLGDCYYCVSGLPPDIAENHAEACVDLGLEMIRIIAEVRKKRNININMRIGVHSGTIISGIIGYQKIHFDIWSKDVSLANQMETEGEPGKVHITQQTKKLLNKRYNIEPTLKGKTVSQFEKLGIQTFLISPNNTEKTIETKLENGNIYVKNRNSYTPHPKLSAGSRTISKNNSSSSLNGVNETNSDSVVTNEDRESIQPKKVKYYNIIETSYTEDDTAEVYQRRNTDSSILRESDKSDSRDSQRRIAFMNSNITRYKDMMRETFEEMQNNIRKLSLSKYQQWIKFDEINPFTLLFKKNSFEKNFFQMHDPLFKYYLLSELLFVIFLYLIQNFTLSNWQWDNWYIYLTLILISIFFLPLMWMNYFFKYKLNRVLRGLAGLSRIVTYSIWARLCVYTIVCVLFSICVFSEMINCKERWTLGERNEVPNTSQRSFISVLGERVDYGICIIPWHMTQTCTLAIIVTFLFLRMIMWVKFIYASIITISYSICLWHVSDGLLQTDAETYNYGLNSKIAHIMNVAILTFTLHIIDRQCEYLNRLDFLWNQNLKEEQTKIRSRYIVNKMLLNNVLPEHLAEMYLDITRPPAALYHEKYADAAVMFASIVVHQNMELEDEVLLTTMSQIISDFDKLIMKGGFGHPIEKIKVAKLTYMAACGISPGYGEVEYRDPSIHVEALLKFASAMISQLSKIKNQHFPDMKLRIGISNGEIVAGVVGSKKPLYDIWGDPVNMASRMDTTGEPNKIQVLEHTSNIIKNRGYKCTLRGNTFVKGLNGAVPTYFVDLNDNFDLIRNENE